MAFTELPPEWNEEGVEPPQSKKDSGFVPGDKPPAQWWNWFMNRMYKVLAELQGKAAEKTYVDSKDQTLQTNLNTHTGATAAGVHGSTSAATAGKLVHRDSAGRAQVAAPSAAADIARKDTVDAAIAAAASDATGKANAVQTSLTTHKTAATLDHPDGSVTDAKIGNRTVTDTVAPTGDSGTVSTLFGWIGNMIRAITGKSSWRTPPVTSIEALNTNKLNASAYTAADVLSKIKTVDGGGSGLDADLLDGIDSARFIFGDNGRGTTAVSDLNSITKSGHYWGNTDTLNKPDTANGGVFHVQYDGTDTWAMQIFIKQSTDVFYYRRKQSGTWQPWMTLANADDSRIIALSPGTYNDLDVMNVDVILCNTATGDITINNIAFTNSGKKLRLVKYNTANQLTVKFNQDDAMFMTGGKDLVMGSTERYGFAELFCAGNSWYGSIVADWGGKYWSNENSAASLAANGYQRLLSGWIIQWGTATSVPPNTNTSVTFPIAFPVAANVRSISAICNSGNANSNVAVNNLSTTSFNVIHNAGAAVSIHWMAIGY